MRILVAVLRAEHEFVSRDVPRINVEAEIRAKYFTYSAGMKLPHSPQWEGEGKS